MQHPARPRYCPTCGGPNPDGRATACRFCDGPLVALGLPDPRQTVRCSGCGAAQPRTSSFCGDCGFGLAMTDGLPAPGPCPACDRALDGWGLAPTEARPAGHPIAACRDCGGVWLPTETRNALIDDAAARARGLGHTPERQVARRQLPTGTLSAAIRYRICPSCTQMMARKNFGGCSGVLVDECRCGSFFDTGELEDVLTFVRTGGLMLATRRADEERTRQLRNAESAALHARASGGGYGTIDGISSPLEVSVVGWLGRWIARLLT